MTENEYLTTRELAELLRIKERKVYDLAASGEVPCTRATGKLLFPRRAVKAWLDSHASGAGAAAAATRPAVFLGSHDPLLEWALKESGSGLASFFDGSLDGLERFTAGDGIAAALHLYERGGTWNREHVAGRLAGQPVVLVEFCWRQRGLITAPGEDRISGIADLKGRRLAPRQPRAGSQILLLELLAAESIGTDEVTFCRTAHTETDLAAAVFAGEADAALGLEGPARRYRLDFLPVIRERLDLVVDRRAWFEPPFQAFIRFCVADAFAARAAELGGYDVSGLGNVHFNG